MEHLLELQNLHVSYHTPRGTVQAVRGIDLTLDSGEVLAVVGESGCGKSALLKAVMRLLPENASVTGKILVNDTDIAPYPEKQLQKLREPHPVKRTVKKYKVFPVSSQALLAVFYAARQSACFSIGVSTPRLR